LSTEKIKKIPKKIPFDITLYKIKSCQKSFLYTQPRHTAHDRSAKRASKLKILLNFDKKMKVLNDF